MLRRKGVRGYAWVVFMAWLSFVSIITSIVGFALTSRNGGRPEDNVYLNGWVQFIGAAAGAGGPSGWTPRPTYPVARPYYFGQ